MCNLITKWYRLCSQFGINLCFFACASNNQLCKIGKKNIKLQICKCSKYLPGSKPIKLSRQWKLYYSWSVTLPYAQNQSSFCQVSQHLILKGILPIPSKKDCLPSEADSQFEVLNLLPVLNHSARQYKMLCVPLQFSHTSIFIFIRLYILTFFLLFFFCGIIFAPIWNDKRVSFVRILRTISFMVHIVSATLAFRALFQFKGELSFHKINSISAQVRILSCCWAFLRT